MVNKEKLTYRPAAQAFVFNDRGELLIFQPVYWEKGFRIPGGGLHPGETPVAAIKRELKEEFNLDIEVLYQSPIVNKYDWEEEVIRAFIAKEEYYCGQEVTQFVCSILPNQSISVDSSEIKDYLFAAPDNLAPYFLLPGQVEMAARVLADYHLNTKNNYRVFAFLLSSYYTK